MSVKHITTIISVKLFFSSFALSVISFFLCFFLFINLLFHWFSAFLFAFSRSAQSLRAHRSWERELSTHAMEWEKKMNLILVSVWMRFSFCKYLNFFVYGNLCATTTVMMMTTMLLLSSFLFLPLTSNLLECVRAKKPIFSERSQLIEWKMRNEIKYRLI